MSCDGIVYPYIDPDTGMRKWRGRGGEGEITCSSVFVTSSIVDLPVVVSLADDDGLQDGETNFCRHYELQAPVTVVLTAPNEYGDEPPRPFRYWVLDGEDQPEEMLSLSINVTEEECHTARAVYGFRFQTCEDGMEWEEIITLGAEFSITVSDLPGCTDAVAGSQYDCMACPPLDVNAIGPLWAASPHQINAYLEESDAASAIWRTNFPVLCSCLDPLNEGLFRCGNNPHCTSVFSRGEHCELDPACNWHAASYGLITVQGRVKIECACLNSLAQLLVELSYRGFACESRMHGSVCTGCLGGAVPICPEHYPFCCNCVPCCYQAHTFGAFNFGQSGSDGFQIFKTLPTNGTTEDCLAKLATLRGSLWDTGQQCFSGTSGSGPSGQPAKQLDWCWSMNVIF